MWPDRYRQLIYEDPGGSYGSWYRDEMRESREKRDASGITTQRERERKEEEKKKMRRWTGVSCILLEFKDPFDLLRWCSLIDNKS